MLRQALVWVLDREPVEGHARVAAGGMDIAVVELDLTDRDGADLTCKPREADPPIPVLVLTTTFDPGWHT